MFRLLLLALFLIACGDEGTRTPAERDAGWFDSFDSGPITTVVACTGANECRGQRTCEGATCGTCTCTNLPGPGPTVSVGHVVDLHSRGDESAVVLLTAEPWLKHLEISETGSLVSRAIPLSEPLESAQRVYVARDGAIYVQRQVGEAMSFHKLDPSGETIWSYRVPATWFAGFAEDASGSIFGGLYGDGAMQAVRFEPTGVEVVATAEYESFGEHFGRPLREFTLLSSSAFLFTADANPGEYSEPFLARFQDGSGRGVYITGNEYGSISGVAMHESTLYVGHGSNNFNNVFTLAIESYSTSFVRSWRRSFEVYVDPARWDSSQARSYRRVSLARVANRLVVGTKLEDRTDGGVLPTLQVFDLDGTLVDSVDDVGPVRLLAAGGAGSVFVVWADRLGRDRDEVPFISLVTVP